jgi:predicted small lipoprotein YifL
MRQNHRRIGRRDKLRSRVALLCAALVFALSACAGRKSSTEEPPATAQATPQAASNQESQPSFITNGVQPESGPNTSSSSTPAPPKASEVQAALARTYKGAVAFDERDARAVVGDFNGDGSEDLAVVVRVSKDRLADLNDELSNWMVADPLKVQPPDPRSFDPHEGVQKLAPAPTRPRVEAGDSLVVIIHGFKESGWRNPEAMQTYLLKNVAGEELKTERHADAQADTQKRLRLLGDVIRERLKDESGFLYWTGASYGWFH